MYICLYTLDKQDVIAISNKTQVFFFLFLSDCLTSPFPFKSNMMRTIVLRFLVVSCSLYEKKKYISKKNLNELDDRMGIIFFTTLILKLESIDEFLILLLFFSSKMSSELTGWVNIVRVKKEERVRRKKMCFCCESIWCPR